MLMMLPFEAPTLFEGIHKSYFKMPRVVKDQRSKFENDELFRQLSHESAVKYTGFKDRPLEERQMKFIASCQEGHTEISVVQTGNQFMLMFNPTANPAYNNEGCDFDKELGKVHIKSAFILNGVCVFWRGWIDLQRLEGFGCLEFDEYRAYLEESMVKQQIEKQQSCNNVSASATGPAGAASNPHQISPAGPHPLANSHPLAPLNSMQGPVGLPHPSGLDPSAMAAAMSQPSCLMNPSQATLADSAAAAQYGNAALAAAAAAAFHQALGGNPGPMGPMPMGLGNASSALNAAAAAFANGVANGTPLPPYPNNAAPIHHQPSTNGTGLLPNFGTRLSPTSNNNSDRPTNNNSSGNIHNNTKRASKSPTEQKYDTKISSNHHNHSHNNNNNTKDHHSHNQHHRHNNHHSTPSNNTASYHRHASKRSHEDNEEIDVVSDITSHDLDFTAAKRLYKSEALTTGPSHHQHHRQSRKAMS